MTTVRPVIAVTKVTVSGVAVYPIGVGGMPMGYGMMGMPMGGFYGGSWGHTNVYAYNHTTDVYASNHNNAFVDNHGGGDFYHPGRGR